MLVMALIAKHLLTINIKCLKIKKERKNKKINKNEIHKNFSCLYL